MQRTAIALFLSLSLFGCDASNNASSLSIQGSDTEVQLVSNLAEQFSKKESGTDISVTGGGSSVGIAALINGETTIANSSRPMKEKERTQAKEKGLDLQEFILARDGLSVIVHPENPLKDLSMDTLGKIYRGEITHWKEVGGTDAPMELYGRQSTSGTFGFFRDTVVKGDYAATMRQMEGTQAIVDAVKNDVHGIGYVGVGYIRGATDIRIVNIAATEGGTPISPLDKDAVMEGRYPIFRPIYQYLGALPAKDSPAARFLQFEASGEGQRIVEESGFYPVTQEDKAANDALFSRLP